MEKDQSTSGKMVAGARRCRSLNHLGRPDENSCTERRRRRSGRSFTKLKRKQDQGLPVHFDKQTVGQFLTEWLTLYVKPSRKPKTYISYEQIVRVHVIPAVGNIQLAKLKPEPVQRLLNDKATEGKSSRTIQYIHAVLRSAFNKAVKLGYMERNVMALVETPQLSQKEASPFTPEQALQFLKTLDGNRLEGLFRVAVCLGMRQGEILGLRWEDIDLQGRTVSVRRTLQRIKMPGEKTSRLIETEPKRGSRRDLPMPQGVYQAS